MKVCILDHEKFSRLGNHLSSNSIFSILSFTYFFYYQLPLFSSSSRGTTGQLEFDNQHQPPPFIPPVHCHTANIGTYMWTYLKKRWDCPQILQPQSADMTFQVTFMNVSNIFIFTSQVPPSSIRTQSQRWERMQWHPSVPLPLPPPWQRRSTRSYKKSCSRSGGGLGIKEVVVQGVKIHCLTWSCK